MRQLPEVFAVIVERLASILDSFDILAQALGAMVGTALALFLAGLVLVNLWQEIGRPRARAALDFLLSAPRRLARKFFPKGRP